MKKNTLVLVSLILFLVTTGASYTVFSSTASRSPGTKIVTPEPGNTSGKPTPTPKVDPSLPKTAVCPLNGAMFTELEKEVWMARRPLAVMIENSVDARPQSGLGTADIVYEAVAEGGITRFMGMYYCDAAMAGNLTFAPVRSARIYFVNLVSEYDALYNHVGGAGNCGDPNVDPRAMALCLIDTARIKNMDQMGYAGDFKTCHRLTNRTGKDVAYEHTMACFQEGIYAKAAKLGWGYKDTKGVAWDKNFVSWKFKALTEKASGSPATNISYMFWESNRDFNQSWDVSWKYDSVLGAYLRSNGGEQSIDLNSGDPLKFKTVVVQFAKETHLGDLEKHLLYDVVGKGKALVFMDGVAQEATWSKASRTARTLFKDASGKDFKFNPGAIWISILPSTNTVNYN